jgi:lipoprotein signal peptidase
LIISVIVSVYIVRKNQPTSWSNATSLFLLGAGIANFIPYLIVTPDFAWRYLIFSNIIWLLSILAAWNPVNGKQSS